MIGIPDRLLLMNHDLKFPRQIEKIGRRFEMIRCVAMLTHNDVTVLIIFLIRSMPTRR